MKQQQKRERHKQMIKQLLSGSQLLNSDPSETKIKIVNNKIISNHTVNVVVVDYVNVLIAGYIGSVANLPVLCDVTGHDFVCY